MKKKVLSIILVTLFCGLLGGTAASSSFDPDGLIDWYVGDQMWQTVKNGDWSTDPNDQMSDEELEQILTMAMKMQSAVQWTPWYFIAVKDVDEQRGIIGDRWGAPEDVATEGTVTVLVLADQILTEEEGHVTPYEGIYYAVPTYSYFDSGAAAALMHVAAASMGYYTHYFGSINGEYAPFALADGKYQSMSRYVKDEYIRGWGYMAGEYGDEELNQDYFYPVKGNTVFVMAIVIGKPAVDVDDNGVDTMTWATNRARPSNWAIWD